MKRGTQEEIDAEERMVMGLRRLGWGKKRAFGHYHKATGKSWDTFCRRWNRAGERLLRGEKAAWPE